MKKRGKVYNSTNDLNVKAAMLSAEVGEGVDTAVLINAGWVVKPHQVYYATKRDEKSDYGVKKPLPPHTPGFFTIFFPPLT